MTINYDNDNISLFHSLQNTCALSLPLRRLTSNNRWQLEKRSNYECMSCYIANWWYYYSIFLSNFAKFPIHRTFPLCWIFNMQSLKPISFKESKAEIITCPYKQWQALRKVTKIKVLSFVVLFRKLQVSWNRLGLWISHNTFTCPLDASWILVIPLSVHPSIYASPLVDIVVTDFVLLINTFWLHVTLCI